MAKNTPNLKGMRYLTDIKNILNELRKTPCNTKKSEDMPEAQNKNTKQVECIALPGEKSAHGTKEDQYQCKDLLQIRVKELELENARLLKYTRKKDYFQSTGTLGKLISDKDKKIEQLTRHLHESEQKETNARLVTECTLREHLDTVQTMKQCHERNKKEFNKEIEKIRSTGFYRANPDELEQISDRKYKNLEGPSKCLNESQRHKNTKESTIYIGKQNELQIRMDGPTEMNLKHQQECSGHFSDKIIQVDDNFDNDTNLPNGSEQNALKKGVSTRNGLEQKQIQIENVFKRREKEYKSQIYCLNTNITEYQTEIKDLNTKTREIENELKLKHEKLQYKMDLQNELGEKQKDKIENLTSLLQQREKSLSNNKIVINKYQNIIKQCYNTIKQNYEQIRAFRTDTYRLKTKILDLQSNIQVFIRLKPSKKNILTVLDNNITVNQNKLSNIFSFDRVYSQSSQSDLFFDISYLLHGFLKGWNVCLFAYGQTGSGKTYTILGEPEAQGILPRAIDYIYDYLDAQLNSNTDVPFKNQKTINKASGINKGSDPFKKFISMKKTDLVKHCTPNKSEIYRETDLFKDSSIIVNSKSNRSALRNDTLKENPLKYSLKDQETFEGNSSLNTSPPLNSIDIPNSHSVNISQEIQKDHETALKQLNTLSDTNLVGYSLELNIFEIYNETVRDLIENRDLKNNELEKNGTQIRKKEEMMELITSSMQKRRIEATKCNMNSSRSHTVYSIKLRQEISTKREENLEIRKQTLKNADPDKINSPSSNIHGINQKDVEQIKNIHGINQKDVKQIKNIHGINQKDVEQIKNINGINQKDVEQIKNINGINQKDVEQIKNIHGTTKYNDISTTPDQIKEILHDQKEMNQQALIETIAPLRTRDDLIVIESVFNFIDLAGSERVKSSGVEGARLKETQFINKSLLNLRMVFSSLINNQLVPYRDSKLTVILKQVLEKKCKTVMLCNVSGESVDLNESICTLRFGQLAENVNIGRGERNITKYRHTG